MKTEIELSDLISLVSSYASKAEYIPDYILLNKECLKFMVINYPKNRFDNFQWDFLIKIKEIDLIYLYEIFLETGCWNELIDCIKYKTDDLEHFRGKEQFEKLLKHIKNKGDDLDKQWL